MPERESLLPDVQQIRDALPPRGTPHHEMPIYMQRDQQHTNALHATLDAIESELAEHREGRSATAKVLDRCVKATRVKNRALEVVRAEIDLPEHIAEIVGDALAKDVGRA